MTNTLPAPASAPPPVQQTNGKATASLVLGIVSFFINPLAIATILGIVFGVQGLRAAPALGGRNKAVLGIILSIVGVVVSLVVFITLISGMGAAASKAVGDTASNPVVATQAAADPTQAAAKAPGETKAPVATKAPVTKAPVVVPAEYLNALAQAKEYNELAHLSKKGLYAQLVSAYGGQFPKKAAKYAVKHVGADWKANALAQAKDYEETAHLSNAGLHDQLVSAYGGQFTESEAAYAIKHLND